MKEKLFFKIHKKWYTGEAPCFYDTDSFAWKSILEDNYELIKNELFMVLKTKNNELKNIHPPFDFFENGWKTFPLYSYMIKYPENIRKMPKTNTILKSIPHLITAQFSILNPNTRIKAHQGDTNGIIRLHFGISIPAAYPKCGFRCGSEERGWENGALLAFSEARRHYAWNYSNEDRIVLILDVIHPDYIKQKTFIGAGLLSSTAMKFIALRFKLTKKLPYFLVRSFHVLITFFFYVLLLIQEYHGINILFKFSIVRKLLKEK